MTLEWESARVYELGVSTPEGLLRQLSRPLFLIGVFYGVCAFAAPHRLPSSAHVFYFHVVSFKKGSSELSQVDKEALSAILQNVKDRSQKIEQAHVAVWSDRLPSAKSLSSVNDRAVAEKRIVAIEDHLETTLGLSYVESYNMAERTNWFARAFVANPRDVKSLFNQKGAPQNVTPDDFQIVKSKAAASRAVILFELDPAAAMAPESSTDPKN